MNRRSFLTTTALGAAVPLRPAEAAAAPAEPLTAGQAAVDSSGKLNSPPRGPSAQKSSAEIKLGVASYSFRKKSLAETIRGLQKLNVKYMKMNSEAHLPLGSTPAQIAEAKRMLDDAGIVLESTGNNGMDREQDIRPKFEFNKQLGVKFMGIAPALATLPLIEKCVKEYGIGIAIHNHGPEDKHFPTVASALKALQGTDPRMGVCVDIGHSARAGEDFIAAMRAAGPRLVDIDGKDMRQTNGKWIDHAVGEGAFPIAAMFKTLQAMRWNGVMHLEYEIDPDDPLPGMTKSFAYMRGVLAGLRA